MPSMWYDKEQGKWFQKTPGTDQVVEMGGPEDRAARDEARAQAIQSDRQNLMNWDRDYSGYYDRLYGAGMSSDSRPSFMRSGGGAFDLSGYTEGSWRNQFNQRMDRIRKRDGAEDAGFFSGQAGGGYGLHGYNELRSASSQGGEVFQRNNAIMDLHRRGYSYNQISDYIGGKRDIIAEGPDWADYNKERQQWNQSNTEGNPLTGGGPQGSFWGDGYFIGAPEQSSNPLLPSSSGGGDMSTGKGFLGAYREKRAEIEESKASVSSLFKEMEEYEAEE